MFNPLEFIFLNLSASTLGVGILVNHFEKYVPKLIVQTFRYGSFTAKGTKLNIVTTFEVPKSSFKHFYVFSAIYSISAFLYTIFLYTYNIPANKYVLMFLDLWVPGQRKPSVCGLTALCLLCLFTMQCTRRLYETTYLQVFAANGKINIAHYLAGHFHYFGCITTVLAQSPGYAGTVEQSVWVDTYSIVVLVPCVMLFMKSWHEQYQSNVIFANLRIDKKSGEIMSAEHKIPSGRWFELVSSPHRLTEILLYFALLILLPTRTFFTIFLWVFANQVITAVQAHWWYLETFKNYPRKRSAIFPNMW